MTIDIAQAGFHALTSATAAIRTHYAGVRATVNAEATVGAAYTAPELLDALVAATAWPNPPSSGDAWVGLSLPSTRPHAGLAMAYGRTTYRLRARCGVRSTEYRLGAGGAVDDPDVTAQDAGWKRGALLVRCVSTTLVRHLTDYAGIYSATLVGVTPLPQDRTGGNNTFTTDVDLDVSMITYNAALTA